MKKQIIFGMIMSVVVLVLAGCGVLDNAGQPAVGTENASGISDYDSFVSWLNEQDATVEEVGPFTQTFFDTEGQTVRINGEDVQVFEFADGSTVDQVAQTVLPDGTSVGTINVDTIATPHFFKSGRIIVLYMGDNTEISQLLESGLGSQFAGG